MKTTASVRTISFVTVLLLAGGCGSGDDPGGASGETAAARTSSAGETPEPIVPSDPFYGASPEAVAEKVFVQFGGERSGMTAEVVLEALQSDPVDTVPVDIRGVRLGMTLEEAREALLASMPEGSRFEVQSIGHLRSALGLETTGPLTLDLPATYPWKAGASEPVVTKERVALEFAQPPAKNVVQMITRQDPMQYSQSGTKTSVAAYRQALIDKYGPPDQEIPLGNQLALKWLYSPDDVDCMSWRGIQPDWTYQRVGHPADCSTALVYSIGAGADGIVTGANAWMGNPGLIRLNGVAIQALNRQLREQANAEKAAAATDKPNL